MARVPRYVMQFEPNNCWAACLEMWMDGDLGWSWTQEQMMKSVESFIIGPGGINIDALGRTIDRFLSTSTSQMEWRTVESADKIPYINRILSDVGNVYVAYSLPGGGGHCNVLFDMSGGGFQAFDPAPSFGRVVRSREYYFSAFPSFVGWRRTNSVPSTHDWTGTPPWGYAPG